MASDDQEDSQNEAGSFMLIEHGGVAPRIHPTAWVAPTATVSGDVEVGPDSRVLFGAVLTAEGGPVRLGSRCDIMENAVLRGTRRHPLTVGDRVLVGPRAYLSGCTVADEAFLATGSAVFNGARVGFRAEVRIRTGGPVQATWTATPCASTAPCGT